MSGKPDPRLLLPRSIRRLPADLAAVLGLLLVTACTVFLPGIRETPIRIVFGVVLALFVPGYAFTAALFPTASTSDDDRISTENDRKPTGEFPSSTITRVERWTLSVGTSIAVIVVLGLLVELSPWRISVGSYFLAVSAFVTLAVAVAAVRRWELPPERRLRASPLDAAKRAFRWLFDPPTGVDRWLNAALIVGLLVGATTVGYAVMEPQQSGSLTEFYLLTEGEDGDLVADGYPTNFTEGEPRELFVGVENHEGETTRYTVVTKLQRVQRDDGTTGVEEERELRRFSTELADGETWHQRHDVTLETTGERMRLVYLLYRGPPPSEPTIENAYRETHLWINATASAGD